MGTGYSPSSQKWMYGLRKFNSLSLCQIEVIEGDRDCPQAALLQMLNNNAGQRGLTRALTAADAYNPWPLV